MENLKNEADSMQHEGEKQLDEAVEARKVAEHDIDQANIQILKAVGKIGDAHVEKDGAVAIMEEANDKASNAVQEELDANNAIDAGKRLKRYDVAKDANKALNVANEKEMSANVAAKDAEGIIKGADRVADAQDAAVAQAREMRNKAVAARDEVSCLEPFFISHCKTFVLILLQLHISLTRTPRFFRLFTTSWKRKH